MADTAGRILIVDDEPPLLRMMSLYLGRMGYGVTVASSALKARTALAESPGGFAVVVLDATMPNSSLPELGSDILADGSVRLIVASGYPVDISGLEAAAPGRVAFLHKPFSPEMLAATVRRMLAPKEEGV
jgi:DNA-binding NtrC family response regulator